MLDDSRRGFLKTFGVAASATSVGSIASGQEITGADQWEQPHGWTTFREGPQRTGAIAEAGLAPYATTDWTLTLDGTMRTGDQGHVAEPVLADGTLYLAVATETGTYDSRGYVAAYDSTTGDQLWKRTDLPAPRTPAVGDEMLYVATNPPNISQDGHGGFVALDADTGETGWYRDDHLDWADPLLVAGNLYTSRLGRSGNDQSVYQLDPSTGETIWKTDAVGGQISYANGMLFVSTGSALDANDGSVQWNISTETGVDATIQTVRDGRVFGVGRREEENKYVIQSWSATDGTPRWMYSFDENDKHISRLAVDDKRVYFVTQVDDPTNTSGPSASITALAADNGMLQWRSTTDAYLAGDPTVADGTLYVSGKYGPASSPDPEVPAYYKGAVFVLDAASGEYEWGYVLDSENTAGTPVVVDETVYTATYDPTELEAEYVNATLYALKSSTNRPDAAHRPGTDEKDGSDEEDNQQNNNPAGNEGGFSSDDGRFGIDDSGSNGNDGESVNNDNGDVRNGNAGDEDAGNETDTENETDAGNETATENNTDADNVPGFTAGGGLLGGALGLEWLRQKASVDESTNVNESSE